MLKAVKWLDVFPSYFTGDGLEGRTTEAGTWLTPCTSQGLTGDRNDNGNIPSILLKMCFGMQNQNAEVWHPRK